mmetsp:Transcript_10700/g.12991  ORF Transcript_10700/g.12991 Transcript_10700/m.12991 type:complete len:86 (+) Transcript_10700:47-304(+)
MEKSCEILIPLTKRLKTDALNENCPSFYLIENGFDPSNIHQCKKGGIFGQNEAGITPMWWACKNGDLWMCEWLFNNGGSTQLSSI